MTSRIWPIVAFCHVIAPISKTQAQEAQDLRQETDTLAIDNAAAGSAPLIRLVQEAEYLLSRGQVEFALRKYEEAVSAGAGSSQVLNRIAEIYLRSGQPLRAIPHLRRSLQEEPGQLAAYSALNEAFFASGNIDSAKYYVHQARELAPVNSGVYSRLGFLHMQSQEWDRARAQIDTALMLSDENTEAHHLLALLHTRVEKADSALMSYRRVLELDPEDVEAHNNIAFLLAAERQYPEALEWYKRTKELVTDPNLLHTINLNVESIRAIMAGKLRARFILVETESKGRDLLRRIGTGEDFAELAARFSVAPNAQDGGDLGFFGPGDMRPEVEEEVVRLDVGQVSELIPIGTRFMLLQRLN
ncbi:MAG: tetratricopeptide repeat protein [Candidatus Latescibacterota bacterium]|nr:tetratricopeptide repeat protein [Candidatus Latescibacterota bacterium]